MTEMNEIDTYFNGRLGNSFKLYLRTKVISNKEFYNGSQVNIRARIEKIGKLLDDEYLTNIPATIKILINNKVVYKDNIELDFKYNSSVSFMYENIYNVSDTTKYNIKAILEVNDTTDYINTTELSTSIILQPITSSKMYISLDENNSIFTVTTTLEPDFIEYKVNEDNWIKLESNSFKLDKDNIDKYIQARCKYNNKYYYSNVVKVMK
jgi:hypothetical protein